MNMDITLRNLFLLLTIIFFVYKILYVTSKSHKKNLPPSPPSLPILGHLHLVKAPYYKDFQALSKRYGPIFSLRMGSQPILVVSSPLEAEECLVQNDVIFANRPNFLNGKHLGYNFSHIVWAPYGEHWRNLRRLATITMLSMRKINESSSSRKLEIHNMIKELLHCSSKGDKMNKSVDLGVIIDKLTRNCIMRIVNGKQWEKVFLLIAEFTNVCDFSPLLRWVGYKGMEKNLMRVKKERDEFVQELIDEARDKRMREKSCDVSNYNNQKVEMKTLIEELLDLQEAEPHYYTDDIIKGHILVMLIAASQNIAVALKYAMSSLLENRNIMAKAREEIDINIGTKRLVDEYDLLNLNYLNCIVNETLRQAPIAPLLIPHHSSKECTIGGFHISKGTALFVNVWAIHMDPNLWDEPSVFKPERFENKQVAQLEFKFLPFGIGRRACPGVNMALRCVSIILATLIQCFDWDIIEGQPIEDSTKKEKGNFMSNILNPMNEKSLKAICYPRSSMVDVLSQISGR